MLSRGLTPAVPGAFQCTLKRQMNKSEKIGTTFLGHLLLPYVLQFAAIQTPCRVNILGERGDWNLTGSQVGCKAGMAQGAKSLW